MTELQVITSVIAMWFIIIPLSAVLNAYNQERKENIVLKFWAGIGSGCYLQDKRYTKILFRGTYEECREEYIRLTR